MNRPPFVAPDFAGHCKIFPERDVMLLPYQQRWVNDNSRLKLCEKSRQIGLSWCTAYRVVRAKSKTRREAGRMDLQSRDEVQAQLFIEDAKRFADILERRSRRTRARTSSTIQGHTAFTFRFANGLRIHSMSQQPRRASWQSAAIRILDEFALHPDPRKLYTISYPGITWGGSTGNLLHASRHGEFF